MKKNIFFGIMTIGILSLSGFRPSDNKHFALIENKADNRIDIQIDGEPFTSYYYPTSLMKPVLYPLRTAKGTLVTRGWPLIPRPGERVDHPHHVGLWFNYGDVNGLDFWNNSHAIPAEKKNHYGTIRHAHVNKMEATDDHALLDVTKYWQKPDGSKLLEENTKYIFRGDKNTRVIELTTTLTALKEDVSFKDNKEGLIGMRVARALELPTNESVKFTDASGNITKVAQSNNKEVTGNYLSSEGITGDAVWGTRAKWVSLAGKIDDEPISIIILDHPSNIGYPTYWHARGYGLFAANPLGQHAMSGGKETLNFSLAAGKSVTFHYQILIHSGQQLSATEINSYAKTFARSFK